MSVEERWRRLRQGWSEGVDESGGKGKKEMLGEYG